jgi:hypothetical protein
MIDPQSPIGRSGSHWRLGRPCCLTRSGHAGITTTTYHERQPQCALSTCWECYAKDSQSFNIEVWSNEHFSITSSSSNDHPLNPHTMGVSRIPYAGEIRASAGHVCELEHCVPDGRGNYELFELRKHRSLLSEFGSQGIEGYNLQLGRTTS